MMQGGRGCHPLTQREVRPLDCFVQLLHREVLDLLVVNQPEIKQIV